MSDSSRAGWLRALFDKRTDHGNDVMVAQFFCSLSRARDFQGNFNINVIKTVNVVVKNKSTTIFHGLFSDRPKLYSENTRPGPLVPLEF